MNLSLLSRIYIFENVMKNCNFIFLFLESSELWVMETENSLSLFLLMNPSMIPRSSEILHSLRGLFYFQPFLSFCLVTKKAKKKINSFNKIRSLLFFFFVFFLFLYTFRHCVNESLWIGLKVAESEVAFSSFFFFFPACE